MILNVALSSSLAIAADKSENQAGDDVTVVPSTIVPTEKLLSPHHIKLQVSTAPANTSFFTSFTKNQPASTGAQNDELVVLPRGLWTITWSICAKFQASGSLGVATAFNLRIVMEGDTQDIHSIFRMATFLYEAHGQFRVLLKENATLRLNTAATGVSDAMDCAVCLQGEKNV